MLERQQLLTKERELDAQIASKIESMEKGIAYEKKRG